ncbi:hypothetical protein HJFPF1_03035 [Paramyrothecium foliicola]|nr:hypothetical protein HJFPF1_03035 [Paramyrothecium foliicola]
MSIRDRVRRALRNKSDTGSDSDSASQSDSSPATPTTSNTSQSSDSVLSLSSKLSKTFTWGSRDKDSSSSTSKDKNKRRNRPLHPSERPLTAQNLMHQQMLGHFTMTFGTSNLSQLDLDGVSPCCTRAPSIDGLAITPGYSQIGRTSISDDEIAPA